MAMFQLCVVNLAKRLEGYSTLTLPNTEQTRHSIQWDNVPERTAIRIPEMPMGLVNALRSALLAASL